MKRLTVRIVISLLTIIAGVCVAGSLLYQPPPAASQTPALATSPPQTDEPSESLEAAYIEGDKLSYAGYDVERSFDEKEHQSSARIKKDGKTLETVCCGGLEKVTTRFGLFKRAERNDERHAFHHSALCLLTDLIFSCVASYRESDRP